MYTWGLASPSLGDIRGIRPHPTPYYNSMNKYITLNSLSIAYTVERSECLTCNQECCGSIPAEDDNWKICKALEERTPKIPYVTLRAADG